MEDNRSFNPVQKAIALFLTLISCFGILIPVTGFAYYFGYLGAFGLDTDSFPISLWDLWKNCVYAAIELALIVPKPLGILLVLILGLLTGFIYSLGLNSFAESLDEMGWIPKFLKKEISPSLPEVNRISRWLLSNSKLPLVVFFFIFLLLIAFFAFVGLASLGGTKGKKDITSYHAFGCFGKTWESCVTYSNPNNPQSVSYNGLLFAASSTHIAILDGTGVSVIPRTSDYVLTRQLNVETVSEP
jgi:hypothetical protein